MNDLVVEGGRQKGSLAEVAGLFLKLGVIGFGGPAAHIALMESEVVRRRKWLTHEEFLDLLGATNLIPGPNSTEMAIHIGHKQAGWPGLLVAGSCFILPAMLIVMGCAWAYTRFGTLPEVQGILYGVKPVIIAVVVQALWGLSRSAVKSAALAALGGAVVVGSFFQVNELLLLVVAGALAIVLAKAGAGQQKGSVAAIPPLIGMAQGTAVSGAGGAAKAFGLWPMFLFFLKVGSILYGSGYVLLAFLRAELVEKWGWLSEAQLLDAVAVGQVTPGPVFTTATFIGYLLGGTPAALLATLGIFLPSFIFVAMSGPLIPRLRRSKLAGAFLDGVNVASLGLMAAVTWQLGRSAVMDVVTIILALTSALLLLRFKVNSAWLIAGGAIAGLALHRG